MIGDAALDALIAELVAWNDDDVGDPLSLERTALKNQAADAIAALRQEVARMKWREAHYMTPDCTGTLVGEGGERKYVPDCVTLRAALARAEAAPTSEDIKACCEWLQERDESMCHWAAATLRQQAREIAYLKQSTAYKMFKQAVEAKLAAEAERDALLSAVKRAMALCDEESRGPKNVLLAAIDAARQAAGGKQ